MAHRVLATSCGLKSRLRAATAAKTARNPRVSGVSASACARSMVRPSVARDHATFETPCGVQPTSGRRGRSRAGPDADAAGLEACRSKLVATAERISRTRSLRGFKPSLAAPHAALASSWGLNLEACNFAAVSTRSTRVDARSPRPSLPHAWSRLASWRDSTWRACFPTRFAAAASRGSTRAAAGPASARRPSGDFARRWSAVPQLTTLNSSTWRSTRSSTSEASAQRASCWLSST